MNVKRYTARTTRDALALVRQSLGEDAVVLSTKPTSGGGIEVLAMAPESLGQVERLASAAAVPAAAAPSARTASTRPAPASRAGAKAAAERIEPALDTSASSAEQDAARLQMSTLSFQDYVRERMLKKRQAAIEAESRFPAGAAGDIALDEADTEAPFVSTLEPTSRTAPAARSAASMESGRGAASTEAARSAAPIDAAVESQIQAAPAVRTAAAAPRRDSPLLQDALLRTADPVPADPFGEDEPAHVHDARLEREHALLHELRAMKGLIEERFGALAFMEKLQRQPAQVRLIQGLLDCGFSPALIRKLADGLPAGVADETAWAAGIIERNLHTGEAEAALEDQGGVYALVGPTGVGKTTSTAKLAAAFATKYGSGNLGLVTLDAYRVGAHEQLRTYGRILGVPVHTAHDRASLEDLLELLAGKKMVLIDTAGMAQRDTRTRELLEMLSHRAIRKLLVVNAAAQGETVEDVLGAYGARSCAGIVLSKMDEAVKLAPALDALIRHKLKVVGVANGQRVPEDWHRLSAHALVQRALKGGGSSAYRLDASDVTLVFTAPQAAPRAALHA
jgi:flagellar biosynthesis protein FlhF